MKLLQQMQQVYFNWKTKGYNRKFIIAVDCDDTVFADRFPYTGDAILETIESIKYMSIYEDVEIVMWTCRGGESLINAINSCTEFNIPISQYNRHSNITLNELQDYGIIPSRKLYADLYIDDIAFSPNYLSTQVTEQLILSKYCHWVNKEDAEPYFVIGVDYRSLFDSEDNTITTVYKMLHRLCKYDRVALVVWNNYELSSRELNKLKHTLLPFRQINTDLPEIIDYWMTKTYTVSPKISLSAYITQNALNPHYCNYQIIGEDYGKI